MHSRSEKQLLAALLAVVLLLALVLGAAPPLQAAELCSRVSLDPPPAWLSDAMWIPSPSDKIFAVDAGLNRILLYSPNGKATALAEPAKEYPSLVTSLGGRVLLKVVGGGVVSLDPAHLADFAERQAGPALKSIATSEGRRLSAINQWSGVGDSTILAFGHVRAENQGEQAQSGLFRIAAGSERGELLQHVDSWGYYVVGYNYLTAIGATGYFLDMDGRAQLYEVAADGAKRVLRDAIPQQFGVAGPIDAAMNGPQDAPHLYSRLEQLTMVAGIYGNPGDGKLYVLARQPAAKGGTDWWLFQIDPKGGRMVAGEGPQGAIVGKIRLPTASNFLSLVVAPADDNHAAAVHVFERGKVDGLGSQSIKTMLTVSLAAFQNAPQQGVGPCGRLNE